MPIISHSLWLLPIALEEGLSAVSNLPSERGLAVWLIGL